MAVRRDAQRTTINDSTATRFRGRGRAVLAAAVLGLSLVSGAPPAAADPTSPLTVTVVGSPSPVASGAQLTYTIQVTNTAGAKVTNVVVTDQVNGVGVVTSPPGLPQLTITSTLGSCTQGGSNGNLVTCNPGTLQSGQTVTITIRGQVTAPNGTTLNDTATATATKTAQNFTTSGSTSVPVQGGTGGGSLPDLTINKTGPTSVAPNGALTYTLTVNNIGTANTANVKVVDTLPAGVALAATPFSTTSLFTCAGSGSPVTVTCTGGTVNAGANGTITINAVAPASGTLTNTAVVDPDGAIAESNELNNTSATVNTSVTGPAPAPLLSLAINDGDPVGPAWAAGAGPDPVNPGQLLTYRMQVKNNATTRADDVVVSQGTQGLEAASITASQVVVNGTLGTTGGCSVSGASIACRVRTLNPGGTITVTVTGTVVSTAGASLFTSATVNGNIKNTGVTNTASEVTTVRPAVDLTITKAGPAMACARTWPRDSQHLTGNASGAPAASGDIPAIGLVADPVCLGGLTYAFVVGNSGNAAVTNVTVRDPLPTGVVLDSYDTDGGFVCSVSTTNVVTCTGGSIGAASTVNLRFRVVTPSTLGDLTNTATVDPNNAIFESDETNNTATSTTQITTGVDLVVWKDDKAGVDPPGGAPPLTEGFDAVATSGTETTTVIVDNVGTQNTTGIKVLDTLPAGTKFLSVRADKGFTCSHDGSPTGGNVTCTGGHLLGTASEFYNPAGAAPAAPGDEFATITIKYFATPFVQKFMHNVVQVDPDGTIAEVDELNNGFADDTEVTVGDADKGAFNQLTVTKTQTDPSVSAGDPDSTVATNGTLVYDLAVANLGTDPVSAVVVQDFLPTGARFISAVDTNLASDPSDAFLCTHDGSATGGTVTCTGGALSGTVNQIPSSGGPVPTSRHITVTMFAPNTPGSYANVAKVDPANVVPEGNEFDNTSTVVTKVTVGGNNMFNELGVTKTQTNPASNKVATASPVTYAITVTNSGSDPAFNVRAVDTLPAGFTFISALDTSGPADPYRFVCLPASGNTIDCTGATLSGTVNAAGTNPTSRTIVVKAFSSTVPGSYTNTVVVDPANAIPEGDETNNTANATTAVSNGGPGKWIDLETSMTRTTPADPPPGSDVEYLVTVSNSGSQDAFNVSLDDAIPAHTTFHNAGDVSPGTGMFTCAYADGTVHCTGGTVPAGGSRQISIQVTVVSDIAPFAVDQSDVHIRITNQAVVDPGNAIAEGDETNNASSVDTTIQPNINLRVTKEGPDTAHQNDEADYVITVYNDKPAAAPSGAVARNVHMVDSLPVGLIPLWVQAEPSNFNCALFENPVNMVDCVGDVASGDSVKVTVHVFVTAASGPLDNEACVDPGHLVAESDETDNCVHKVTESTPKVPKLLLNISADAASVTAGQQLTYNLTVSNVGEADTTGTVTLVTPSGLPGAVTLVNTNPDSGVDCSASTSTSLSCDIATLPAGGAASVKVIVTVDDPVSVPSFTLSATASGGGAASGSSASLTTFVGGSGIDLVVTNVTDLPDPVAVGAVLTYRIDVLNAGTSDASAFDVTQTFDSLSGLTFVSAVGSEGFTCSLADPTVTCTGALLAGHSTTLTVTFVATAAAVPSVHSVVTADSGGAIAESDEGNNTADVTTTVNGDICQSCIDLAVGPVLASPDPVTNGDQVTWNVDVTNIGDRATSTDPAPNAVVIRVDVDKAFNEYSGLSASAPGFTCTVTSRAAGDATPEIVCTASNLAAGAGTIVSVTATASTAATPSVLFFDVAADPGFNIAEFNEANNTGSSIVGVS